VDTVEIDGRSLSMDIELLTVRLDLAYPDGSRRWRSAIMPVDIHTVRAPTIPKIRKNTEAVRLNLSERPIAAHGGATAEPSYRKKLLWEKIGSAGRHAANQSDWGSL
jgi:hypothetical protein